MTTIEAIDEKITSLNEIINNFNEADLEELDEVKAQLLILKECEQVFADEEILSSYDFSKVIEMLEDNDLGFDDLSKTLKDIQNIIKIRRELNVSDKEVPFAVSQVKAFRVFVEKFSELKNRLNNRYTELSKSTSSKSRLESMESLKKLLEGKGRRKYYTESMINDFFDEFDLLNMNPKEAKDILSGFFDTKNLNSRHSAVKANYEDILDLYREYVSDFNVMESLLDKHRKEIVSKIDLDNTREILEFFKKEGILDKFKKTTLLQISVFGKANYIINDLYPKIKSKPVNKQKQYFNDTLATVWVKQPGTGNHRGGTFNYLYSSNPNNNKKSLYSRCHSVDIDELEENIKYLKANNNLFDPSFQIDLISEDAEGMRLKRMPTWLLKKNVELCKLFGLGYLTELPFSLVDQIDIEDKIHLAVELGLLNPPMTPEFIGMEKDIVNNYKFEKNVSKKNIYNQSIRNYFQRYASLLNKIPINEYAYMFSDLNKLGYIGFYNNFLSSAKAGQADRSYLESAKEITNNPTAMKELVANNFMNEWYPDKIDNYYEYESVITEKNTLLKTGVADKQDYYDYTILDDPLIQKLEEHCVYDTITSNDQIIQNKNEYIYLFNNRIISRYKVLHNASLLKEEYGYLDEDMLMTSIVRNSFIDPKSYDLIESTVRERGKTL